MTQERPSDARLSILLTDYTMARDDERQFNATLFTVLSIGIAVAAGLAAFATDSCAFADVTREERAAGATCSEVPDEFFAAAPLVPFITIVVMAIFGVVATLRGFYIRALETEMRALGTPLRDLAGVRSPSLGRMATAAFSPRRGTWFVRAMYLVLLAGVIVIFLGMSVAFAQKVSPGMRLAMAIGYGGLSALLLYAMRQVSVRGRRFTAELISREFDHASRTPARRVFGLPLADPEPSAGDRTLVSYLLLPRYRELIKWIYAPAGMLLAVASASGVDRDWGALVANTVLLLVVLEYLLYQARYQWNDISGYPADQEHPDRRGRGRLPGPDSRYARHAAISATVAAAKVGSRSCCRSCCRGTASTRRSVPRPWPCSRPSSSPSPSSTRP